MRRDRGDRRWRGGPRRPRLHAEHRGPPPPAGERGGQSAARRGSPRRAGRVRGTLMHVESMHFKARAGGALADEVLQANLRKFGASGFALARAKAVADFGPADFERLRTAGADIRDRALATLDAYIERFEREAKRRGATVLFAETRAEACALVLEICRRHGVKKAIKSKSMLSEEAGLNEALAAAGVEPVETDLGEYILQLAGEPPSHIIAPAVHKSKDEVADLFEARHRAP